MLKLIVEKDTDTTSIPAALAARVKNQKEFIKQYHAVTHVTDVIKEELLTRLNKCLFPGNGALTSAEMEIHLKNNAHRIQTLKEVIDLLP